MTGLQRRTPQQQRRNRSSRAWVFCTAGLAGVAAAGGVAAILLTSSRTPAESQPAPLATNITGAQAVGLANPGEAQAGGAAGAATLLSESQVGLTFTPSSGGENVQPSQQWQADQMGGGAYILVFTPDGLCLTATATKHGPSAQLARCGLGLSQRWNHPYLGTDATGRTYWQLRSAANGRCLGVGGNQPDGGIGVAMLSCSKAKPWQQLISFWTAF
jgi:hypothetical protein